MPLQKRQMQRSLIAVKERIRKFTLEQRREMSFEDVFAKSSAVQERLINSPFLHACLACKTTRPCRVALYSSFQNEVLTDVVFEYAAGKGMDIYFPKALRETRHVAFFKVTSMAGMCPGSYDILEPSANEEEAKPETLDLIIVPGVAFDTNGGRIGYGKGYYDKALANAKCPIIALAYDFQVLNERLPAEPHDIPVTAIITEKRVITANRKAR
ncbi:5-formyltetrahydrofolate cyclo-ligase [bacterium]|nr:MAG: 5-formyltetrahydrofolate cyclo-ligase [bacterium]